MRNAMNSSRATRDLLSRRKALRLSQIQLGELAGVSQSNVSDAERGNRVLPEYLAKIDEALSLAERNAENSSEIVPAVVSARQPEQVSSNDEAMTAPRHLSAVHPARTAPLPSDVEAALGAAFRRTAALVSDLKAVEQIAARVPTDGRTPAELESVFAEILDAAARLREHKEDITAEALLIEALAARRQDT